jgi:hypothetical protein
MKTKTYTFRPCGHDEGDVVELTTAQERRIQQRLDELEDEYGDPPYYLYELGHITVQEIEALLDGDRPRQP